MTTPIALTPRAPDGSPAWAVRIVQDICAWVLRRAVGPQAMSSYTVAGLPDATKFLNHAIIVSNETGGRTMATSDGTNWKRVRDGATVS